MKITEKEELNTKENRIILYHGSKSGLRGNIDPVSRKNCDFGCGFYMGTEPSQPLTLICNFPEARFYTLEFDLEGLRLFNLDLTLDWALLIAYNRGKMESVKDTELYRKYQFLTRDYDAVCGYIANDRMFVVLDRFFSGEITDTALIHSLSALKLGSQYVAVTKRACRQIKILSDRPIEDRERKSLQTVSEQNRREGIAQADAICRKYRREGRYFDEIISGGE